MNIYYRMYLRTKAKYLNKVNVITRRQVLSSLSPFRRNHLRASGAKSLNSDANAGGHINFTPIVGLGRLIVALRNSPQVVGPWLTANCE